MRVLLEPSAALERTNLKLLDAAFASVSSGLTIVHRPGCDARQHAPSRSSIQHGHSAGAEGRGLPAGGWPRARRPPPTNSAASTRRATCSRSQSPWGQDPDDFQRSHARGEVGLLRRRPQRIVPGRQEVAAVGPEKAPSAIRTVPLRASVALEAGGGASRAREPTPFHGELRCPCFVPDTQVSRGSGRFWRFRSGLSR